jgi:hypothetical protein
MSARNPSLLGWLFGRGKKRRAAPKRKPSAKRAPATRPPKAPKPKPYRGAATEKMAAARRKQTKVPRIYSDAYVRDTLAGKHGAEALRRLLSTARTAKRNPSEGPGFEAARRASRTFHGAGAGDVVELSAAERRRYALPRFVVPLGRVNAIEYVPPSGSQRGGAIWRHRATDRGRGQAPARTAPMLVADPRTGRAVEIGGAQRFDPKKGLIG